MKIAFVIASLGQGGAERIAVTLACAWDRQDHSIHLVTFDRPDAVSAYPLRPGIVVEHLDMTRPSAGLIDAIFANGRRVRALRAALSRVRPDVVVSFMLETNVLTLIATMGSSWPVVVSERIHPAFHPVGRVWSLLRRWLYHRADSVVAQTAAIAEWLRVETGARTAVIANPVDVPAFRRAGGSNHSTRKTLLAVGRLESQKGHDLAIAAFAKAADNLPEWDFKIVGEGTERHALQKLIAALGMSDRITLAGATADIAPVYHAADAFVHSARYEGYPNAIVEALTAGKPVIAVDTPGAARELLKGGAYGVLVPTGDGEALSQALRITLSNSQRLGELERVAARATENNAIANVAPIWLRLFDGIRHTA